MIKRTLSVIAMVTMMGNAGNVAADDGGVLRNLVSPLDALELQAAPLKALQSKVAVLEAALAAKQDAMDCLYQVGTDLYVDGCNLHVRNGIGESSSLDPRNGLGNLIVGYDEGYGSYEKTGSHNVVVGPYHHYTHLNGLVTGSFKAITGKDSAVTGGLSNFASGYGSSVSGGKNNTASGYGSSVSGGQLNWTDGPYSSVSGGVANTAKGDYSSVSGGVTNIADGDFETLP